MIPAHPRTSPHIPAHPRTSPHIPGDTASTRVPAVLHVGSASDKGLKEAALGLMSRVVVGTASTAPAYSLAATLAFVVAVIGVKAPVIMVLAFVPM